MILIQHFFNSISTAKHLSKLNNAKFQIIDFIQIFIIRFFFSFSFIRNLIRPQKNKNLKIDPNIFDYTSKDSDQILNILDAQGYYNNLNINQNTLTQLKKSINNNNCYFGFKSGNKSLGSDIESYHDVDELVNLTTHKKIPHIMVKFKNFDNFIFNMAKSDFFLNIARYYLNSKKITCKVECFISNPISISDEEKKKNSQFFHYDLDYKKFLKIFVYLSDVNEQAGPHIFVNETHKKKFLKHILAERISDAEVIQVYGREKLSIFTGKSGSVIIEDTFGLHKGQTPISESRAVLILEYGLGNSILHNDPYIYLS